MEHIIAMNRQDPPPKRSGKEKRVASASPSRQEEKDENELQHQDKKQKRELSQCWAAEAEGCTDDDDIAQSAAADPPCQQQNRPPIEQCTPLLPPRKSKSRSICRAPNCTNRVQRLGLCERHGDYIRARCQHPSGCAAHTQNNSIFCYRHGASPKLCKFSGCSSRVQKRGLCYKHGAGDGVRKCGYRCCRNVAKEGGLCKKHLIGTKVEKDESSPRAIDDDGVMMTMIFRGEENIEAVDVDVEGTSSSTGAQNPLVRNVDLL